MESKNLNDIVIEDNDNSKKAQLKNILTLLALLFIILVISIVITRLILGGDDENSEATQIESNKTELVQSGSSSSAEGLSDGATVAVAATAATAAALATTAIATRGSKDDKAKDNSKALLVERNTTSRKKQSLREHKTKTSSKRVEVKRVRTTAKRAYVPKKRIHHPAPVRKKAVSATRGYYIKVGAFKDPANAVKRIKAENMRYKKVDTKNGMLTRVLVGPYYSRKDAQNDLSKVKSKIAAGAYITKIK